MPGLYKNSSGEKIFFIQPPSFSQGVNDEPLDLKDIIEELEEGECVTFKTYGDQRVSFFKIDGRIMYQTRANAQGVEDEQEEDKRHELTEEKLEYFNDIFLKWLQRQYNRKRDYITFVYEPL